MRKARVTYYIRCLVCSMIPFVMFLIVVCFDNWHAAWPAGDMYYFGPSSYFELIRWPILVSIAINTTICILSAIMFSVSSEKPKVLNNISALLVLLVMVAMLIEITITASAVYHALQTKRTITPVILVMYLGGEILLGAFALILSKANNKTI